MKHFVITFAGFLFLTVGALAQTKTVSTYGRYEKPADYVKIQPGTISLGVGAVYNPTWVTPFNSGISIKYFFNEDWALRGTIQFGRNFKKGQFGAQGGADDWGNVDDEYSNWENEAGGTASNAEGAVNIETIRNSNFLLNVGFEHRHKLSNRIFGYYGTDLAVGASGAIRRLNVLGDADKDASGDNIMELKTDRACNLGILPFVGLEMFLGPRITLGAEFGYSLAFKFYPKDVTRTGATTVKTFPDTSISSNLDFGNSIWVGLRLAYTLF